MINGKTTISTDSDLLSLEDLSRILLCSIDTIRRIPAEDLPVYRIGKSNLHFRDEVLRFVRSRRVSAPCSVNSATKHAGAIDTLIHEMLGSNSVDAREPPLRRAK